MVKLQGYNLAQKKKSDYHKPLMRKIDRTKMAQEHKGKWVALKADRKTVIASGRTVKSVMASAKKKGAKNPIITKMPKNIRSFVGANSQS